MAYTLGPLPVVVKGLSLGSRQSSRHEQKQGDQWVIASL